LVKKNKIALFTNRFPNSVSTFFSRDLFTLIHHGFEVDVFTIYPVEERYWENVPDFFRKEIREKTNIIFVNPFHFRWNTINSEIKLEIQEIFRQSRFYGIPHLIKSMLVVQQAITWKNQFDGRYDYMLSYWGNYASTYAFLANKLSDTKIPYSFFLHAGIDLYREQIYLDKKILYATKVFLVCDFNREFLMKLYPHTFFSFEEKLFIHHLGIDVANFKFNTSHRDQYTILLIGSFTPVKGFEYAIRAISLLYRKFRDLRLVIIGDGTEKSNLKKISKSLRIEDRVQFTGWLPFEKVKQYLDKCTILVHPSSDLGDAVPTVIKEAMASGLPVIGADIVGIPEILDYGNVGLLFPPRDEIALANSISKLLLAPTYRNELALKAREFVEKKFDMWKNQEILCQLIEMDLK